MGAVFVVHEAPIIEPLLEVGVMQKVMTVADLAYRTSQLNLDAVDFLRTPL